MDTATGTELACFGYLACAQVTAVAAYPAANSGAQVDQVFPSLAGDAPLCALTARRLGTSAHLVSNRVSLDPAGQAVLDTLDTAGVTHQAVPTETGGLGTPQLTIVTDRAGTRTWFAWLGNAVDQLTAVDLSPLVSARLAYVDCYRLIDSAATAAITASRAPLLLNLGGDPLSDAIAAAAAQRHVAVVQTNLDEPAAEQAETLAAQLFDRLSPEAVLYGTDEYFTDSVDVAALKPRLVRIEEPGDTYTLAGRPSKTVSSSPTAPPARPGGNTEPPPRLPKPPPPNA